MFAILDQANLDKTLEALTFRAQFEMKVAELLTDVRVVSKACEEMRNSSRLREVLRVRCFESLSLLCHLLNFRHM